MWFLALCALAPVVVSSADWTLGVEDALHLSVGTVFQAVNADGLLKWTFDAGLPIVTHQEGLNGTIHVFAQSTMETKGIHYMLDGNDGSIQWEYASHAAGLCLQGEVRLLKSDINVYLVCNSDSDSGKVQTQIQAIDVVAGTWKWSEFGPGAENLVSVGPDGGVLAQSQTYQPGVVSDCLSSFHPENGTTKWTAKMELLEPSGGWVLSEGDIFVASAALGDKAHLVQLNGEDGSTRWNASHDFMMKQARPKVAPISGCNGEVFVPNLKDEDGNCSIHAFDFNGNTLRTLPCSHSFNHQHSTRQNEDGSEEDIFVSYNIDEGAQRTTIIAYSGTTGYLLWNASIAGDYATLGTKFYFGLDGTVVVANQEEVVAIRNGKEAWRVPLEHVGGALIAKDGTTYLMCIDSIHEEVEVVAVDTRGGKWWYHFPDLTVGSAANFKSSFAVV